MHRRAVVNNADTLWREWTMKISKYSHILITRAYWWVQRISRGAGQCVWTGRTQLDRCTQAPHTQTTHTQGLFTARRRWVTRLPKTSPFTYTLWVWTHEVTVKCELMKWLPPSETQVGTWLEKGHRQTQRNMGETWQQQDYLLNVETVRARRGGHCHHM